MNLRNSYDMRLKKNNSISDQLNYKNSINGYSSAAQINTKEDKKEDKKEEEEKDE